MCVLEHGVCAPGRFPCLKEFISIVPHMRCCPLERHVTVHLRGTCVPVGCEVETEMEEDDLPVIPDLEHKCVLGWVAPLTNLTLTIPAAVLWGQIPKTFSTSLI
jgi:hypothetical protein